MLSAGHRCPTLCVSVRKRSARKEWAFRRLPLSLSALSLMVGLAFPGGARAAEQLPITSFVSWYAAPEEGAGLSQAYAAGDLNSSARGDVVFAEPYASATAINAGRVSIFLDPALQGETQSVTSGQVVLTGEAGWELGASVSAGRDLSGDGKPDLVIGAPGADNARGRIYIFFGGSIGEGLTLADADVVMYGDQDGMRFGSSVLLAGDINDDAREDLVVSAPGWDEGSNQLDRGTVYLFLGNSLDWTTRDLPTADGLYRGARNGDQLGSTLAALGDLNDDGVNDWAIGAPLNDDGGTDAGMVYVYLGSADLTLGEGQVALTTLIQYRGEAAGDQLGSAMAGGAYITDDDYADAILGAPYQDINGSDSGRAYVIKGRRAGWPVVTTTISEATELTFFGAQANAQLGARDGLALADVTGDGQAELLFGARGASLGGADAGALYLFQGRASGWGASNSVNAADLIVGGNAGDLLGTLTARSVVDIDSNGTLDLLLGSAGSDVLASDGGAVYPVSSLAFWMDQDRDGYSPVEGDCNDDDPSINPGVPQDDRDGEDNDCDGEVDEDANGGCRGSIVPGEDRLSGGALLLGVLGLLRLRRRR